MSLSPKRMLAYTILYIFVVVAAALLSYLFLQDNKETNHFIFAGLGVIALTITTLCLKKVENGFLVFLLIFVKFTLSLTGLIIILHFAVMGNPFVIGFIATSFIIAIVSAICASFDKKLKKPLIKLFKGIRNATAYFLYWVGYMFIVYIVILFGLVIFFTFFTNYCIYEIREIGVWYFSSFSAISSGVISVSLAYFRILGKFIFSNENEITKGRE